MARQIINIGTVANDGTGDNARTVGTKLNDMFAEVYQAIAAGGGGGGAGLGSVVIPAGADPTASGDSRAAIQTALDTAKSFERGGVVYLPPGTYKIGAPGLVLPSRVTLTGFPGSRTATCIRLADGSGAANAVWADHTVHGAFADNGVRHLTLECGRYGGNTGNGIWLKNTKDQGAINKATLMKTTDAHVIVKDVAIIQAGNDGLWYEGAGECEFSDILVVQVRRDGFGFSTYDCFLVNSHVAACGRHGIYAGVANFRFEQIKVFFGGSQGGSGGGNARYGVYSPQGSQRNAFVNVEIQDGWHHGFRFESVRSSTLIGCSSDASGACWPVYTQGGIAPTGDIHGFSFVNCTGILAQGCHAFDRYVLDGWGGGPHGHYGFHLSGSSSDCLIEGVARASHFKTGKLQNTATGTGNVVNIVG